MKNLIILAAVAAISACAKEPDAIPAADVGQTAYSAHSCSQLASAKLVHDQNLVNLSASQKQAASGDALGVILFGIPMSSMSGADKETQISVTKGHIQAIEREQLRKRC